MTSIINIKSGDKYDIYCGRAGHGQDGYFGNRHLIGYCNEMTCHCEHDRDGAIEAYKIDFNYKIKHDSQFFLRVLELKDKILGCFCKPLACHCDVIKEYLDNLKLNIDEKFVTGVGSREIPENIISIIKDISLKLSNNGYILRSGGADGADSAFEEGWNGIKEIYLPWKGFNNNNSLLYNVSKEALELASTIHPAWSRLSFGAKKLHGRNCYQVLGQNLNIPSNLLICWTKEGKSIGGTRTAIILAQNNNIPVYNLAIKNDLDKILKFI